MISLNIFLPLLCCTPANASSCVGIGAGVNGLPFLLAFFSAFAFFLSIFFTSFAYWLACFFSALAAFFAALASFFAIFDSLLKAVPSL